ncbi:MAG: MerR family DNA-binding protein [Rhodospirillales bacterium]|nr:MerR family DNA-binding protein [Rhodospirillales bacterium]
MPDMTIGKAAERAGVGVETVRFYERRGLIDRPRRPATGGFRIYPRETVERIRFIRQAQTLGFSLEEIGDLLSLRADPRAECGAVRRRAEDKLQEVDRKLGQLQQIRRALEAVIAACPGERALDRCSVLEFLERNGTGPQPGREH